MFTETYKNHTINIVTDEKAIDPLSVPTLGTLAIFHSDFQLGHTVPFNNIEDMEQALKVGYYVYQPVYLIESNKELHLTCYAPKANAEAYKVGFIFADHKKVLSKLSTQRMGIAIKREALRLMAEEVLCYDTFLHGRVCAYTILEGDKTIDAVTGFNDALEALSAAKKSINARVIKVKATQHVITANKPVIEGTEPKTAIETVRNFLNNRPFRTLKVEHA